MRPTAITIHNVSLGARGSRRNRRPTSWGSRSSLWLLHRRQAATTFSQTWRPPRERGTTWSTFSARSPQYWQTWSSRTNTARLDNPARALKGTFTKYRRRMTLGAWSTRLAPRTGRAPGTSTSAFSFRTSTTARRTGTTQIGWYDAFRTSARSTPGSRCNDHETCSQYNGTSWLKAGRAILESPSAAARSSAAPVAAATDAGVARTPAPMAAACRIDLTPRRLSRPGPVRTAPPTSQGPWATASASTSSPAARRIAPATPEPSQPWLLAAFTIASTARSVMSPSHSHTSAGPQRVSGRPLTRTSVTSASISSVQGVVPEVGEHLDRLVPVQGLLAGGQQEQRPLGHGRQRGGGGEGVDRPGQALLGGALDVAGDPLHELAAHLVQDGLQLRVVHRRLGPQQQHVGVALVQVGQPAQHLGQAGAHVAGAPRLHRQLLQRARAPARPAPPACSGNRRRRSRAPRPRR